MKKNQIYNEKIKLIILQLDENNLIILDPFDNKEEDPILVRKKSICLFK